MKIENIQQLNELGAMLAQSKILGNINPAAGAAILFGLEQSDMKLFDFMQRYHVIPAGVKTEIAKKAETMLADFLAEDGAKMDIKERSPERCAVEFELRGAKYLSELTWEYAQTEAYTKNSRGQLKDNWATPRKRMQMMWARVVSDGLRAVCPMATKGTYTPEEAMDFDDDKPSREPSELTADPAAMPVSLDLEAMGTPVAPPTAPEEPPKVVAVFERHEHQASAQMPVPASQPPVSLPDYIPERLPADVPHQSIPTPNMPLTTMSPAPAPAAPGSLDPALDGKFIQRGPEGLDYSICRTRGKYTGQPWTSVPEHVRRIALTATIENVFQQDRDYIRTTLTQGGN